MHLPSTKINQKSRITVTRMLPAPGEIVVKAGQLVNALMVVARAEIPAGYHVIDVAQRLRQPRVDMEAVLHVEIGDFVESGDIVASQQGIVPFLGPTVRAPISGHVAAIGSSWLILETKRTITEIQAFTNGVVSRLLANSQGVIIEANGALIEAACGFGGEAYGRLKRLVNSPYESIDIEAVDENMSEAIVLGGRTIDETILRTLEAWHVRGVIVGSIPVELLRLDPPVQVRVVATEGFGDIPMAAHTFGVLTSLSRREVSIRGRTPNRVRKSSNPLRDDPPVIVAADPPISRGGSYAGFSAISKKAQSSEVSVGSKVRIVQGKWFGHSGVIDLVPPDPQATECGIIVPGAYVRLNNDVHYIPWANLKRIE